MEIDFRNIKEQIVSIDDFDLKWRFTERNYNVLPEKDLSQLMPLSKKAARFLHSYITINIQKEFPFTKGLFNKEDHFLMDRNQNMTRNWLSDRGLRPDEEIFISWNSDAAMIVPCKILIKYYEDFCYPGSDDVTALCKNNECSLLFHHTGTIYWGTK